MEYLKEFNSIGDYSQYIESTDANFPNVSLISDNIVKYKRSATIKEMGIKFTAISDQALRIQRFGTSEPNIEYSYDCITWTLWPSFSTSESIAFGTNEHPSIYVRGKNPTGLNHAIDDLIMFGLTKSPDTKLEGNVMDLIDWETHPTTIPCDNCFVGLFADCSAMTEVANVLPATGLTKGCYSYMFIGDGIATIAEDLLPATVLATECYSSMFAGCTQLIKAPNLPAETLAVGCYSEMFKSCIRLNEIHCSATDISALGCTVNWVSNAVETGDFYGKTAANWTDGISGIPNGWTKHLD